MKLPGFRFHKKISSRFRLDNRGSAIVTAIVVTLFISIIATTMLFVSGRNFIMKQTDYQNKQSFYKAERTLDTLKELLVADVEEAYEVAYKDMMREYVSLSSDDAKAKHLAEIYSKKLTKTWEEYVESGYEGEQTSLGAVRKIMAGDGSNPDRVEMAKLITGVQGAQVITMSGIDWFIIKGIQVYYVDDNGFSSYIYTDIALTPPEYKVESGSTSTEPEPVNMLENVIYVNWEKGRIADEG